MNLSTSTRFASGVHLYKNKLDLLLWFEKVVLPENVMDSANLGHDSYSLLRDSNILVSERELIKQGILNTSDTFKGQQGQEAPFGGSATFNFKSKIFTSWSPKEFSQYLRKGGLIAPSVYEIETDFMNAYSKGDSTCLGVVLKNLPKIDFDKTDFRQFLNFIKSDETIRLRRRLFSWQNEVEKSNLTPVEIQELIATRLDDYKAWIDTAKMKHETKSLETILLIVAEVAENIIRLKPSKAIRALFEFRKRELDLSLEELNAPGRELAFIHQARQEFSGG